MSKDNKGSSPNNTPRRSGRTKGVPLNFGYVKRSNGSVTAQEVQTSLLAGSGRTAHVSAVPRTHKLKVSGGTQTTTTDFQQSKIF